MTLAVVVESYGGTEKLVFREFATPKPQKGEVLIRHTAIGVNYIDVYHRTGLYPNKTPFIPGVEGAGVIEALGEGVEGFRIGDRVCYGTATNRPAGYTTHRCLSTDYLVKIPIDIADEVAATLMVKGLTAVYLISRTFMAIPGNFLLVHAAAGGVGTYLCQMANYIGAPVIGTVGSEEKVKWAIENGCTYPVNYKTEDFVKRVQEITKGAGVSAVYDSVGKDTFLKSFECLTNLGIVISYGQSSGPVPPFDISILSKGSYFLTRPSLGVYFEDRQRLIMSCAELFEAVRKGIIKPRITHRIPLKNAADAHKLLEDRQTMGSIILIP